MVKRLIAILVVCLGVGTSHAVSKYPSSQPSVDEAWQKFTELLAKDVFEGWKLWWLWPRLSWDEEAFENAIKALKGRETTLENVPVSGPSEVLPDGSVCVTVGCPGAKREDRALHSYRLRLRFSSQTEALAALTRHDRLATVKVRFSGTWKYPMIDGEGLACTVAPDQDLLPEFDAATIGGDELLQLICWEKLDERQYAGLRRQLAGRRLTFNKMWLRDVRKVSDVNTWKCEITPIIPGEAEMLQAAEEAGMHVSLRARYPIAVRLLNVDEQANQLFPYVNSDEGIYPREIEGTVDDDPALCEGNLPGGQALLLKDVRVRFNRGPEELSKIDAETVTGDQIAALYATRKELIPNRLVELLQATLVGRVLTFDELTVLETPRISLDGKETLFCQTANPSNTGLMIVFTVPVGIFDALSHDPVAGDRLKVSGRVAKATRRCEGLVVYGRTLFSLEEVSIEALHGESKYLPDEVVDNLSGREMLAALEQLPKEVRMTNLWRLCRRLKGRRLTFTRARMGGKVSRARDGTVDCTLEMGNEFKYVFSARLPNGPQADRVLNTLEGEMIGPFTCELALAPPRRWLQRNDALGPELLDVRFDPPKKGRPALPAFDEKTITGDALLKMLKEYEGKLSPAQCLELVWKLRERRMTFTCNANVVVAGGGRPRVVQAEVGAGFCLRFDLPASTTFSQVNKVVRITGTADVRSLEGRENLGVLCFHDVVLEPQP